MSENEMYSSLDPSQGCWMLGAMRAFHGIKDGFVVLHSPPGCHSGSLLMNCLPDNSSMRMILSGLHPQDLVYGAERKALLTLKKLHKSFNPNFIVLMDCCAASIIGEDLQAMIEEAENEGVTAALTYFNGAGFHGVMWQGYEEAMLSLVQFMDGTVEKKKKSINLIGFMADETRSQADLAEITRVCNALGIEINSVLAACQFSDIINAPKAELNVVLGGNGINLAKEMAEKFSIPYVVTDYPYGFSGTCDFLMNISKSLDVKVDELFLESEQDNIKKTIEKVQFYLRGLYAQPCAVIGSAGKATSLARFLSEEVGLEIKLLAITSKNSFYDDECVDKIDALSECIMLENDRKELEDQIRESDIHIIFGSTFEKKLGLLAGAPLVRYSYPVVDMVSLTDSPYAGFRGVATWLEEIVNSLFSFSNKLGEEMF